MVHGNVHPGTVLVGDDGRVVLADARATDGDTTETDVRAIGGVLYFALTGHWPHAEAGPSSLPDAVRDGSGAIAAPRQVRAGVPAYLDDLTMDLLDRRLALPPADVLAAELDRLDVAGRRAVPRRRGRAAAVQPPRTRSSRPSRRPPGRKVAVGVAGAARGRHGRSPPGHQRAVRRRHRHRQPRPTTSAPAPARPPRRAQPAAGRGQAQPWRSSPTRSASSTPTATAPSSTTSEALVDGDRDTAWESDSYTTRRSAASRAWAS